ncbi:MAG: D-aminoacyl-tRNA deacylase, partial [Candidatus Thermoplasmatota archaeon]|nr:D-aminoacyl-tRNA deacylase [Candidatus Thermoplasmatota archaeon]
MNLIIASNADSASINLRKRLLEMSSWTKCGEYDGNDMWEITEDRGDYCKKGTRLISINNIHIKAERIDEDYEIKENVKINNIIFLSRHKAASGKPSLTVHPIGNWGKAEYGGEEGKITPASPKIMTSLLREIKENQLEGFDVCFEATHHGPLLNTPTIFLEIGST